MPLRTRFPPIAAHDSAQPRESAQSDAEAMREFYDDNTYSYIEGNWRDDVEAGNDFTEDDLYERPSKPNGR
jgi:hypothetical protein